MSAGVPQQVESIRVGVPLAVIGSHDRQRTILRELGGEVAQDPIDLATEGLLGQPGSYIARDLERCNRGLVGELRSIWKSDQGHG